MGKEEERRAEEEERRERDVILMRIEEKRCAWSALFCGKEGWVSAKRRM